MNSILANAGWTKWVFFEAVLAFLFLAMATIFCFRLWRGLSPQAPYFSSTFVLTLCPQLCCSLIGAVRLLKLGDVNLRYIDNLDQQINPVLNTLLFGPGFSAAAVLLYSVAYAVSRRKFVRPATASV